MSRTRRAIARALALGAASILLATAAATSASAVDLPPLRTIEGSATLMSDIGGIVVAPNGETYIADRNGGAVLVFAAGASGDVAPVRVIVGPTTTLNTIEDLALDSAGRLYVSNGATVAVFAAGADGDVAPVSTLDVPGAGGLAFGAGDALYVSDYFHGAIYVFAPGATGATPPLRTISGANTLLSAPLGIAVTAAGEIATVDYNTQMVMTFAAGADGDVAPIRTIAGPTTQLIYPYYLALSAAGDYVIADYGAEAVFVFSATANGDVAPISQLLGASTLLSGPYPLELSGTELFVGNYDADSIAVYSLAPILPAAIPAPTLAATGVETSAPVAVAALLTLMGAALLVIGARRRARVAQFPSAA